MQFPLLKRLLMLLVLGMAVSSDIKKHKNYALIDLFDTCGLSVADRIFGGQEAYMGQFPWMARLGYLMHSKIVYSGSGSIITKLYILTAAHNHNLWLHLQPVQVTLGDYNDTTDPDCVQGVCAPKVQVISVKEFIRHEMYHHTGDQYDIALIRLESPIQFNDYVQPICLPVGAAANLNLTGQEAEAAGWGAYDYSKTLSNTLKTVKLKIWPEEECRKKMWERRKIPLTEEQICAGGIAGQDTCNGDSGGPLMKAIAEDGLPRYYVVGIVSFGETLCGKKDYAGVYTAVYKFMDWILDHLSS